MKLDRIDCEVCGATSHRNGECQQGQCIHCKQTFDGDVLLETSSGEYCCDQCQFDYCERCLRREADCELDSGDYVCSDCYSGMIDDAYERCRDMD